MEVSQKTVDLYNNLWTIFEPSSKEMENNLLTNSGVKKEWFKGKVCLDAGCGHGGYVKTLSKMPLKKVYALDMNTTTVEKMSKSLPEKQRKKIFIKKAPIQKMPFPDEFFDFVYCQGVLHHIKETKQGFSELCRVLKPGGLLSFGVYGRGGLAYFFADVLRIATTKIPEKTLVKFFSRITSPNEVVRFVDYMHVPIQKHYSEEEIKRWFLDKGMISLKRRHAPWEQCNNPSLKNKILYGESWVQITGIKEKKS